MLDDLIIALGEEAIERSSGVLSKIAKGIIGGSFGSIAALGNTKTNKYTMELNRRLPDVYDPKYLTKHVWISGVPGTGKSNKLRRIFVNSFIKQGWGGIYIDTHGTADEIIGGIPPERWKDVIYVAPWMKRVWGTNVLQRYNFNDTGEVDTIAEDVVDVFSKIYPRSWGDKLANCIRFATKAVLIYQETNKEYVPTLMDVYRMLKDELFREYILQDNNNEVINGFFEALKSHSALGKLENPLSSENVILALCQKDGFNILEAMEQRKIIICNLDNERLSGNGNLIAGMYISMIAKCAAKRSENGNHPYFALAADEFYEYANKHVSTIIAQMRKKKVIALLANQYREQMPKDVQSAVSMAQFKFIHRPADEDLNWVSNLYSQWFTKEQIMKMPYYHCISDEHDPYKERQPYITPVPPFIADYNWSYVHKIKYASLNAAPRRQDVLEELRKEKEELILKASEDNDNSGDIIYDDFEGDITYE